MNSVEREVVILTKLLYPAVRGLWIHRATVPLDEQSVAVVPLIAYILALGLLRLAETGKHIEHILRNLNKTVGALCLGIVRVDTPCLCIVRGVLNVDNARVEVDVVPLQSEHFAATHTRIGNESKEHTIFKRCLLHNLEEALRFIDGIDNALLYAALGDSDFLAGIADRYTVPTT